MFDCDQVVYHVINPIATFLIVLGTIQIRVHFAFKGNVKRNLGILFYYAKNLLKQNKKGSHGLNMTALTFALDS